MDRNAQVNIINRTVPAIKLHSTAKWTKAQAGAYSQRGNGRKPGNYGCKVA